MKKELEVHCLPSLAPPTQQEEYELDKLFLKNIPEGVDEEFLAVFLDGRLDLDHEEDYSVELKNNYASLNFTNKYSVEGICHDNVIFVSNVICFYN